MRLTTNFTFRLLLLYLSIFTHSRRSCHYVHGYLIPYGTRKRPSQTHKITNKHTFHPVTMRIELAGFSALFFLQAALGFTCQRPKQSLEMHPPPQPYSPRFSASKTSLSVTTEKSLQGTLFSKPKNTEIRVLSEDPLVYVIPELLSPTECQAYQHRVSELQQKGRNLTKSNPPQVSLELSKLWPLPFLSLGAGIPPFIRLQQQQQQSLAITPDQIIGVVLPPIAVAMMASITLAFGVLLLVQKMSAGSSRTSEAVAFNLDEDVDFCRDLVDRISSNTGHPWYAWEAPVVTRYEPGAIFARHGDASPNQGKEWADLGGQRVVTCITYLNDVHEGGGETSFDQLGIDVTPHQGDALIFFPADPTSLKADSRTTHESLPPSSEKWIVQMFGRIGPRVPPPLGLPDSFDEAPLPLAAKTLGKHQQ